MPSAPLTSLMSSASYQLRDDCHHLYSEEQA